MSKKETGCDHEDVAWEAVPERDGTGLAYFGKCSTCGQRLAEEFTSNGLWAISENDERTFIKE